MAKDGCGADSAGAEGDQLVHGPVGSPEPAVVPSWRFAGDEPVRDHFAVHARPPNDKTSPAKRQRLPAACHGEDRGRDPEDPHPRLPAVSSVGAAKDNRPPRQRTPASYMTGVQQRGSNHLDTQPRPARQADVTTAPPKCRAKKRTALSASNRGSSWCLPEFTCNDFSFEAKALNSARPSSREMCSSSHCMSTSIGMEI